MEKIECPVCGREFDKEEGLRCGHEVFVCGEACKDDFDDHPANYVET